jgi:uncharacterized protein (DUF2237 family)
MTDPVRQPSGTEQQSDTEKLAEAIRRGVGARMKPCTGFYRHVACYTTRTVTGIPRHVIRLTTLHAIFASVR